MIFEKGYLLLDKKEMSSLACATWNERVENKYEAREFVQSMRLNKGWANDEIKQIEMKEQGEREKIIVETLRIAIKHFEWFEQKAHEVTHSAGLSVNLH